MKIIATQFVSNDKDKNTFVSVFKHYSNLTEKKVSKEGDLYALLAISGGGELPAERICKFVWDGIVDGYLYSNAKSTNESLKDSINEGVRKVKDLIRNDKSIEEIGVNINFVVVAQKEEGLYIGNFGENEIYIYKENRFVNIFEIMKKKKSITAGMALSENDVLLVSTKGLITEGMSNFMGLKNCNEILEALNNFGEQILNSEGMIYFVNTKGEKEGKSIEIKADITKDIPAPRIKLPKKIETGKKVKEFFVKTLGELKNWLLKIKEYLTKKIAPAKDGIKGLLANQKWFKKTDRKKDEIRGMRIDGYKKKDLMVSRVKKLVLIGLIFVLLAVGITMTVNAKKARERHKLALESFQSIESLLTKVEENIIVDIDASETYLFQVGKLFESVPSELNEEDVAKLKELEDRRFSLEDTVYKRFPVTEADGSISKFLDPRLAFGEDSNPTDIEIYKDKSGNEYLLITDSGLKRVHRVALYDKGLDAIPDNEGLVKDPLYISLGNSGIFIYDTVNGVIKSPFSKDSKLGKFVSLSGLSTDSIRSGGIVEMIVLAAEDNVYLLSTEKQSFLKSGFSYENRYNLPFQYIDNEAFASVTDVESDISLYFSTTEEPKLVRYVYSYYEQKQINVNMQAAGFDGEYGNITKLYTMGSGGLFYDLYLFDSSGKRFLRMEKPIESGEDKRHAGQILLKSQVVYRGTQENMWNDVKDFVVDSNQSAIYILEGSAIWKVVL